MKKLLSFIFLALLLSINAYAGMGDTYTCTTEKISQIDNSDKIITNFKKVKFSLKMERLKKENDTFKGKLVFGKNAFGILLEDKLYPVIDFLFMRTHVRPEKVLAHSGNTHAWFQDGTLSLSSHFITKKNPGILYKLVSSVSNCKKNKPEIATG